MNELRSELTSYLCSEWSRQHERHERARRELEESAARLDQIRSEIAYRLAKTGTRCLIAADGYVFLSDAEADDFLAVRSLSPWDVDRLLGPAEISLDLGGGEESDAA